MTSRMSSFAYISDVSSRNANLIQTVYREENIDINLVRDIPRRLRHRLVDRLAKQADVAMRVVFNVGEECGVAVLCKKS